ncbi:AMP-binding protein [Gordonibacter sp. 28C]|uniref:class I adenylate-forming enzyme family protein n=1 Tax=Gordonibacter sp. 28C TaxID=2078569 RepID=UPI000DF7F745|nr:class I adenylate-forming enzyme family protein [Gordonibacter sp. 28C]RDB64430.1 AMP-binding protein [Gordonibacter sp. 28C]
MYAGKDYLSLLNYWSGLTPNAEAVFDGADRRLSYGELCHETEVLQTFLVDKGLRKGDNVLVVLGNTVDFVSLFFAVTRIGAVFIACDTAIEPELVKSRAGFSCPKIAVFSEANELCRAEEFKSVSATLVFSKEGSEPVTENTFFLEDVLAVGKIDASSVSCCEYDATKDPVLIAFTSGSTGNPKGAMLTAENIFRAARNIGYRMHVSSEDVFVVPLPVTHMFGLVVGMLLPLLFGARIVLPKRYSPSLILQLIEKEHATVIYGVPTMFIYELDVQKEKKADISSLKTGMVAGAFCPENLMIRIGDEMGIDVLVGYGSTEAVSISTTLPEDDLRSRTCTVGRVFDGNKVRVVDANNNPVPLGESGELAYKGYGTMLGYYRMPEETDLVIDSEGWLHMGDLASLDERGYITIHGRIKDLIIRGGNNIDPRDLQKIYLDRADVKDVCVVGYGNEKFGEAICVYVVLEDHVESDSEELREYARGKVPKFAVPDKVVVLEKIPELPSGKHDIVSLRQSLEAEQANS